METTQSTNQHGYLMPMFELRAGGALCNPGPRNGLASPAHHPRSPSRSLGPGFPRLGDYAVSAAHVVSYVIYHKIHRFQSREHGEKSACDPTSPANQPP